MSLPKKLLFFWYPESLLVFLRLWKNCLMFLEEDLAVGLMWRLLFVPLFHDSTFVGHILSFFFRLYRIVIGAIAMLLMTLVILVLALGWFLLPGLIYYLQGDLRVVSLFVLFSGVVLFIYHIISHPSKKLWQIKTPNDIWQASWIKPGQIDFKKLIKDERIKDLLSYLETTPDSFASWIDTPTLERVSEEVWQLGRKLVVTHLGPEHFFVAMISCFPNYTDRLSKLDLKIEDFVNVLDFWQKRQQLWRLVWLWDEDFQVRHLKGVNRGWLGVPTPNLDLVSDDLTRKASRIFVPEFVGRLHEVTQVINTLSLEKGRNVLIVGEVGSGRSELVEYLAKQIVFGDAPAALAIKRIVKLDLVRLLEGIKTQGELAARIQTIFDEVAFTGNIIIFLDEFHTLGIGEVGSQFNLYSLLLPFIESNETQFIATTEAENYTRVVEKNLNLARLFTKVELPPSSIFETVEILKNQAVQYERFKKIKTSLLALKNIANLSSKYIHNQVLPDSALQVFQLCLVKSSGGWIKKSVVEAVVGERSTIPVGEVSAETKKNLLNLEAVIHHQMIGQEEAVIAVAKTLRRAATDLRDEKRPIGSFLFVGPTGVGKTELAKILVDEYFAGKGNFLRLDMSEYQTTDSINRLIGDEVNEGILVETVKNKPYTLILLDEFEKADSKVLNLFLQVLDDGRLSSARGNTVDFTNTIIIATSNAASLIIAEGLKEKKTIGELTETVKSELLKDFKPELVNRFDEVVIFKPLSSTELRKIVDLKLKALQAQLAEKGYKVEFDEAIAQRLVEKGYDPVLGARPLRRLIQDTIEAKLSEMILAGELNKGEVFQAGAFILIT